MADETRYELEKWIDVILALLFLPWRATAAEPGPAATGEAAEGAESAHERAA